MTFKYVWQVVYGDGTVINQFDDNGMNAWSIVDMNQLVKMSWMHGCVVAASIDIGKYDTVKICRRNHIRLGSSIPFLVEYLLGKNGEYTIKME